MKYFGLIGFRETRETSPDIHTSEIVEYPYYGDVLSNGRRFSGGSEVNESLTINNRISIVADPYARTHFWNMAYITWQGAKWVVSEVTEEYPRLVIGLGGLYNASEQA